MYIGTKITLKLSEIVSKVMKKDQSNDVVSSQTTFSLYDFIIFLHQGLF